MLCYKDMTFCQSDCLNSNCRRHWGPREQAGAAAWWSHDPENAPVAFSDFSETCEEYQAPRRQVTG